MKILLVGNHSCANRGDAAILRGLTAELTKYANLQYDILSRYPQNARYFLQQAVGADPFYPTKNLSLFGKLLRRVEPYYLTALFFITRLQPTLLKLLLPQRFKPYIKDLEHYDAVWHVGGSFFIDLYGFAQFDHVISAIAAKKPIVLVAHSVGPFSGWPYRTFAKRLFAKMSHIGLREKVSAEALKDAGFALSNVSFTADTAWLVPATKGISFARKRIAMTVRELAGFAQRLGLNQTQYENAFARLADHFVSRGYEVCFFSTCTAIDGYRYDDRMVALSVKKRCQQPEHIYVEMAELNDVELGEALAGCDLIIATRLHSAIIAMNFGTVAIALNYEHKSRGIFQQMGIAELSYDFQSLSDNTIINTADVVLANLTVWRARVHTAVEAERQLAKDFIQQLVRIEQAR